MSVVRIDKWLWATRFFKTRPLALAAIKNGRVSVNGQRPKPSREIDCGDDLTIERAGEIFEIKVLRLIEKRVGAKLAADCYVETDDSIAARAVARETRSIQRNSMIPPQGRPERRDRARIRRFKGKS